MLANIHSILASELCCRVSLSLLHLFTSQGQLTRQPLGNIYRATHTLPSHPLPSVADSLGPRDVSQSSYTRCRPPIQFQFNVGLVSQPITGSIPVNHLRHWPNTNPTLSLLYTLRKHISKHICHSPNAVSMLTNSLRRWPNIETALGDCTVFAGT